MLEWFRKHAITVAMVIVVTFVATLFAGGYFFSDIGGMGSQRVSDRDQAIAWVGDTHAVPGGVYLRALNRLVEGLSPALQAQFQYDPELFEEIKWMAWRQALQFEMMLNAANTMGLEVTSKELKESLLSFYEDNQLDGKAGLKAALAEQGVSYDAFMAGYTEELLTQKLLRQLTINSQAGPQDVDDHYTSVDFDYFRLAPSETNEGSIEDGESIAVQIAGVAKDNIPFSELKATVNNPDWASETDSLSAQRLSALDPEIIAGIRDLPIGAVSPAIQTTSGWYIFKVTKRSAIAKEANFDMETVQTQLSQERLQVQMAKLLQNYLGGNDIEFQDPSLEAVQAKLFRKVPDAIAAYQRMSSRNPNSPIPHYLLGKLFQNAHNSKKALEEFEKADVKSQLSPEFNTPLIHMALGAIYVKDKKWPQATEQYDKAIESIGTNRALAEDLKRRFQELGNTRRVNQVNEVIKNMPVTMESLKDTSSE